MRRATPWIVVVAALGLLAAGWRYPRFDVAPAQLERNQARWEQLSPDQREQLRGRWLHLRARLRAPEDATVMLRRLGTLNRLLQGMGQRPDAAQRLVEELESLPQRLTAGDPEPDLAALTEELRTSTERRMVAFLGNLAREGRLDESRMAAFELADWDGRVALALQLMKREALYFRAELGAGPEIDALAPLDVAERQAAQRKQRGLVGRAGRLLDLSRDDRLRLAESEPEDFARAFDQVVRPAARRLLLEREVPPERVDELMARPYRSLERILERLLRSRR